MMDTFSKLRPPDAIRIKVKLISLEPTKSGSHDNQKNDFESSPVVLDKIVANTKLNELTSAQPPPTLTQTPNCTNTANKNLDANAKLSFKVISAKKLFVDPQMTSYDMLHNLIVHAFDIKQ